jgi:hypothetical protein
MGLEHGNVLLPGIDGAAYELELRACSPEEALAIAEALLANSKIAESVVLCELLDRREIIRRDWDEDSALSPGSLSPPRQGPGQLSPPLCD